jgi:hypothetical protein
MKHILVLLTVCLLSVSATAEIVDERLRDEAEPELTAKQDGVQDEVQERPAASRDEKKFDEAAERRKKRRDDALELRRLQNANRSHVYQLTRTVIVPAPWFSFDLQRDINRGQIIYMGRPGALGALALGPVNGNVRLQPTLKVLFLQDGNEVLPDSQPNYLAQNGLSVLTPELPLDDFGASVRIAELAASSYRPDVIVGRSRGGAVAMNMNSGNTPILLLSPAWKNRGGVDSVKQKSIILHSPSDAILPFASSEQLRVNSALPPQSLIAVGSDHSLSDRNSLQVMLRACLSLGTR